ncbi:MAG TPA: DUF72 domain-containing protein [Vicinamibacterales bacterium]|nr:DUF72 domain-containing protein [Vicinamibacterales bacterium]
MIHVGTAGWNIPRAHRGRFPEAGSQLQRYAARLNAAEINTSFYRPHAAAIYERWSAAVPAGFRFSVKVPKAITHERGLTRARDPLVRFLDEIAGLGRHLGPLLVQLPPSHAFESRRVGRFLELLRSRHDGAVVCEPRHVTWTTKTAEALLKRFRVARVAADPPRAAGLETPGGWTGIVYYRWHGSPRPYFSPYSLEQLRALAVKLSGCACDAWCVFDNTGSGSAAGNALDLRRLVA